MKDIMQYEEMIYDDPTFPIVHHADYLASTRRSIYTNWHNGIELLYCFSGEGHVLAECQKHFFREGELVVIGSNVIHTISADSQTCEYYCIIVDHQFLLTHGLPDERLHATMVAKDGEADICKQIIAELLNEEAYCKTMVLSMLLSLFVHLYRNNENAPGPGESVGEGKRTEYIMKALCYIRQHLCEPMALDDICREVAMSRYYFCHLFRAYTGMTVINYINMLRCALARNLILEKRFNVSETAKYLGISNLSYFGQMYKKYMGVLPSKESVKDVPELSRMDPMTFEGKNRVYGILRYGVTFAKFYRT